MASVLGNEIKRKAYESLYNAIINADYVPGQKISEKQLSEDLSIGRTPLREVIFQLRQDGLIHVIPQSGTYITKVNIKEANDARFVRESVETKVIKEAAAKIDELQILELKNIINKQKLMTKKKLYREFHREDNQFHRSFYEIADRGHIWDCLQMISVQLSRFRVIRLKNQHMSWDYLIKQHEAILKAVTAHDLEEAAHLVADHTHLMIDEKAGLLTQYPEFFE